MRKYFPFATRHVFKSEFYKGSLIRAALGLHDQLADIISKKLPMGAKILDFGCGQGALSLRLQDLGYDVLAVDKDANDFQCHGQIKFEKLNFDDQIEMEVFFERHDKEFDMVLGIEVIEHVENPWNYVRDLKTLLKKEGYMLISTPNISSWISRFMFLFTGHFWSFNNDSARKMGHIAPISKWELEWILNKENLKEIQFYEGGGGLPLFWITKNFVILTYSFLNLACYPFMKGFKRAYCLIVLAQK